MEMQGSFEINGSISGQKLGDFMWQKDDTATLSIGHQLFEGKLVDLSHPFLIINKGDMNEVGYETKACQVHAVIKRKVVFKNRPKSIIVRNNELE